MAFNRFRPSSHFIAPHSWANDPCGAVYVPESQEYIICYQWNPGTTDGGNSAWGMARSKDLVTWQDCPPAIWNGSTYDCLGVFSGSIVSRLIDSKRVLFLFYTSVSAVPIHWSKPYIEGCETQSVAISMDLGQSWHRHQANPLLSVPPMADATTGWRDPFVSPWPRLSALLGAESDMQYMMLASGERTRGPQLPIYSSPDMVEWKHEGFVLNVKQNSRVAGDSDVLFGLNFECASFFSIGETDYIVVGVEEDESSTKHNGHCLLWLSGALQLKDGSIDFDIRSHGLLDHGVLYAAHLLRDSEDRLLQLGWADETAKKRIVTGQGWAGCLAHPRELFEVTRPVHEAAMQSHEWAVDESGQNMTTLGVRPAEQVKALRCKDSISSLQVFELLRSQNFEIDATFRNMKGREVLTFNVREDRELGEVTKIILNIPEGRITVDRRKSSFHNLGANTPDTGSFYLLPDEDLQIKIFVDASVVEVYANDRFALTSRIYPSSDTALSISYKFEEFEELNLSFECWPALRAAWPQRKENEVDLAMHTSSALDEVVVPRGILTEV